MDFLCIFIVGKRKQMSKKDKFNPWPYAIMLSFVAIIAAIIHTVVIALDNPVHEDKFMGKYQDVDSNYNEIQISQAKFDEKYKTYIKNFSVGGDENSVILKPKNEALLKDLKFSKKFLTTLRENGVNSENLQKFAPNFEIANGDKVSFEIALNPNSQNLSSKISLTRPETNEFNKDLKSKFENGIVKIEEFELPQTGRWQIVAELNDGSDTGFFKFEFISIKK